MVQSQSSWSSFFVGYSKRKWGIENLDCKNCSQEVRVGGNSESHGEQRWSKSYMSEGMLLADLTVEPLAKHHMGYSSYSLNKEYHTKKSGRPFVLTGHAVL